MFTTCPPWIFTDSTANAFGYHETRADVGIVQLSPLSQDLQATCRMLDQWIPFAPDLLDQLAARLRQLNCTGVLCDISPLGIMAAKRAGLPCALIENFTWDWIYEAYLASAPELAPHIQYLRGIYAQPDLHIQTDPLCRSLTGTVRIGPVSRNPHTNPREIRKRLQIPADAKMVLVSMGGVPDRFHFLERMPADLPAHIVIPGAAGLANPHPKVMPLPKRSQFFHPDLLAAADLLIGKAGYSTIAEAFHCGVPFGFIGRTQSPESPPLERFIEAHLASHPVSAEDYESGAWIALLPRLLQLPRTIPPAENGADIAARLVLELISK